MTKTLTPILLCGVWLLAGCGSEPPARSAQEFLDNPIMLEAAVVRCGQNRSESRYDTECMNARQAVSLIEARQERARHDALEIQSKRKRDALRRTQAAAAKARRRSSAEAERQKEAEYLAQFGEPPPPPVIDESIDDTGANAPGAVIPDPVETGDGVVRPDSTLPATDGGNAPGAEITPAQINDAARSEPRQPGEDPGN